MNAKPDRPTRALGKEITVVILSKLMLIFLLWQICFAHPTEHLSSAAMRQHLIGTDVVATDFVGADAIDTDTVASGSVDTDVVGSDAIDTGIVGTDAVDSGVNGTSTSLVHH